jgi:hypothetical protein
LAVLLGFRLSNQNVPLATRMIRLGTGAVERLKSNPMAAKAHMAKGMRMAGVVRGMQKAGMPLESNPGRSLKA